MSNSKRFEGKNAVITASTDGIGYAIAHRLAIEGANVVISSRNQKNVDEAVKVLKSENLNAKGIVCHVGQAAHRQNLLRFSTDNFSKKVDFLISNAAVSPFAGATLEMDEKQLDKIMEVNFKSAFQLVQEFKDSIAEYGSIIFISSYIGYNPQQPIGMYGISKTALFGLTRVLAHEMWEKAKIRVNCVSPGVIKTRFSYVIWGDEEAFKDTRQAIIMDRPGESDEIAGPVAFLCSSDASYITGENLVVAGGIHSRI